MEKDSLNPKTLMSTLWILILFNMVIRDLHEFLRQGYIEELMSLKVGETTMLIYGVVAQIPILMILLSHTLKNKHNKWYNTIAVVITSLGLWSTIYSADLDDIFFVIVQNILLIIILRTSWKLPINKTYKSINL